MIDVIADLHGHADALEALLTRLGYSHRCGGQQRIGTWRHPHARVVSLGDLMDRGPRQGDTIAILRAMRDSGDADLIMGNHEFNAIAYATPRRDDPGFHYRQRHGDNVTHHQSFLDAAGGVDSRRHRDWIDFFRTLPLWYDDNSMRAVHACWSQAAFDGVAPHVDERHVLTEEGLHAVNIRNSEGFRHADILLKGIETDLPPGIHFEDANGSRRHRDRVRCWDRDARHLATALMSVTLDPEQHPDPLPLEAVVPHDDGPPIFFGHYWLKGTPALMGPRHARLDWSVAKGGDSVPTGSMVNATSIHKISSTLPRTASADVPFPCILGVKAAGLRMNQLVLCTAGGDHESGEMPEVR